MRLRSVIGFLLLSLIKSTITKAIYASEFEATVSCETPLMLTESTLIFLNQDLHIDPTCQLIAPAESFLSSDTLTINSNASYSLIIASDIDWGSLLPNGQRLIIKGNVTVVVMPHVAMRLRDTHIELYDNARIVWL